MQVAPDTTPYMFSAQSSPHSNPFIMYSKNGTFFFRLLEISNCTMLGDRLAWNRPKMPRFIIVQRKNHQRASCMHALTTNRSKKKKMIAFVHAYGKWVRARARRPTDRSIFIFFFRSICLRFSFLLILFALALALVQFLPSSSESRVCRAFRELWCCEYATEYAVKWYTLDPLSRRLDCDLAACRTHTHTPTAPASEWMQSGHSQVYWW